MICDVLPVITCELVVYVGGDEEDFADDVADGVVVDDVVGSIVDVFDVVEVVDGVVRNCVGVVVGVVVADVFVGDVGEVVDSIVRNVVLDVAVGDVVVDVPFNVVGGVIVVATTVVNLFVVDVVVGDVGDDVGSVSCNRMVDEISDDVDVVDDELDEVVAGAKVDDGVGLGVIEEDGGDGGVVDVFSMSPLC